MGRLYFCGTLRPNTMMYAVKLLLENGHQYYKGSLMGVPTYVTLKDALLYEDWSRAMLNAADLKNCEVVTVYPAI